MTLPVWSGGLTDTGITVSAKVIASTSCRLAVSSTDPTLATGLTFSSAVMSDSDGWVKLPISGLTANTFYTYGIEVAGAIDPTRGSFKTAPTAAGTGASFTFCFSSCNVSTSTHKVFDSIRTRAPLFLAHLGDLGYAEITTNSPASFRTNYNSILTSATQGPMYAKVPVVYQFDDHDFGGDNSNNTSAAKPAAQTVFRQVVPTYSLPVSDGTYRSFRIGRARFIVTDLRSFRSVDTDTDDATKSMMGATQKAWFKSELLAAKAAGDQAIFWFSSSVWNVLAPFTGQDADLDHWGAFSTERTEIADYVKANNITGLVVCCGDSHSLGYAVAENADFATGGGAPIPVLMASALDQTQTTRNANWTATTTSANAGQYGVVNVTDDGSLLTWDFHGIRADITTGVDSEVMTYVPQFLPNTPPVLTSATLARDWDPAAIHGVSPGTKLSAWTDRVAGDTLTQATAALQPTYQNTDGGFPAVHFNQQHISSTNYTPAATTKTTIVAVVRRTADHLAAAGYVYDGVASTNRRGLLFDNTAGQNQRYRFVNNNSTVSGLATDKEFHTVIVTFGDPESLHVDGAQQASFPFTGTVALTGFRIGARYDSTQMFSGDLVRLCIYEGAISADDRTKLTNWAMATYMRGAGIFVADRGNWVRGRLSPVAT